MQQRQEWKKVDEDSFYDWKLVRKVRRSLKTLREKNDVRGCLGVLETCMRSNFAAVESPRSALCLLSSSLINYQSTRLYSEVCLEPSKCIDVAETFSLDFPRYQGFD